MRADELDAPPEASSAPGGNGGNLFATVLRNASLYAAWRPFVKRLNAASTLPLRHRELLVLRTAWICRSEYVWGQHVLVARTGGVQVRDIEGVREGPDSAYWTPFEAALVAVPDELRRDARVSEPTWAVLASELSADQLLDVLFLAGHYAMVSGVVNSVGVRRETGVPGLDEVGEPSGA